MRRPEDNTRCHPQPLLHVIITGSHYVILQTRVASNSQGSASLSLPSAGVIGLPCLAIHLVILGCGLSLSLELIDGGVFYQPDPSWSYLEKGSSTEELPLPDWPVGGASGAFT